MKNKQNIFIGMVAIIIAMTFTLIGCGSGTASNSEPQKIVELQYQFTSGDGKFTLGETTAVYIDDVRGFSLTEVYTAGGGHSHMMTPHMLIQAYGHTYIAV